MSPKKIIIAQGIVSGVIISFPKGLASFVIINQTLVHGFQKGTVTAIGCMIVTILVSLIVLFPHFERLKKIIIDLAHWFEGRQRLFGVFALFISIYLFFFLKQSRGSELSLAVAIKTSGKLFLMSAIDPLTTLQTIWVFSTATPATIQSIFKVNPIDIFEQDSYHKLLFVYGVLLGTLLWYGMSGLCLIWFSPSINWVNGIFALLFFIIGVFALRLKE